MNPPLKKIIAQTQAWTQTQTQAWTQTQTLAQTQTQPNPLCEP